MATTGTTVTDLRQVAPLAMGPNWATEAEKLAKSVEGVKNVINHIETEGQESLGSVSQDGWITTRIKSSLLFESDLYSLNYTVETSNGVVYLTGIGQNETEINRVVEIARNVSGVKKVVNHVKIKEQEGSPEKISDENVSPGAEQHQEVEDRG